MSPGPIAHRSACSKTNDAEKGVSEYKKKVDTTYRTGYGTVLFFESHKILEDWGKKMPNYSKVRLPYCPNPPKLIDSSNSSTGPRTRLVSFNISFGPLSPKRV
jgi:hypothetical protein